MKPGSVPGFLYKKGWAFAHPHWGPTTDRLTSTAAATTTETASTHAGCPVSEKQHANMCSVVAARERDNEHRTRAGLLVIGSDNQEQREKHAQTTSVSEQAQGRNDE